MLLAALLALGAPREAIARALEPLGLGATFEVVPVRRGGIQAVRLVEPAWAASAVGVEAIEARIADADLGPVARSIARGALELLLAGERAVHGEGGHELHELGLLDTVLDLVGVSAAVEALEVARVAIGPIGVGLGSAPMVHGRYPIPAPAVVEIARAAGLAIEAAPGPERVTPTGMALLGALARELGAEAATGSIVDVAYGAGAREGSSVVQVLLLEDGSREVPDGWDEEVSILETWVDDLSGEDLGGLVDEAIATGALDAALIAGLGKKGRPGTEVRLICAPESERALVAWLQSRTRSAGVRYRRQVRHVVPARLEHVELAGMVVAIKVTPLGSKCEDDDARRLAAHLGVSILEARSLALAAWRAGHGTGPA
jgi:uncharacterized protein (DUF111 family)